MKTHVTVLLDCHRVEITRTCQQDVVALIAEILNAHAEERGYNVAADIQSGVIDIEPRNGVELDVGRKAAQ